MLEIERKFLVDSKGSFRNESVSSEHILQGYLNIDPNRTVRVRTSGTKAYITVKGKSNESGTTRFEWEEEINYNEALELLKLCEEGIIEKVRYNVPCGVHIFQVDEFMGLNQGLIVAEVELKNENDEFLSPAWVREEVTGNDIYYNSYLSKKPFKTW